MIEIFEGRLGGGKTFSAVARILAHLGKGGAVYTNIVLKFENCVKSCAKFYGVEILLDQIIVLTMEQICEFHKFVAGGNSDLPVLVVLDEAHLFFNSRDWSTTSREVLAFLTQSRKVSVDVIFISQSALNMDKQFARLVQYYWRFKDLRKLILPVIGIHYPWPHILVIQCDYDGKLILSRRIVRIAEDIWSCYDTNAILKPIEFAGERKGRRELKRIEAKKSAPLFSRGELIGGLVCSILILIKLWYVFLH